MKRQVALLKLPHGVLWLRDTQAAGAAAWLIPPSLNLERHHFSRVAVPAQQFVSYRVFNLILNMSLSFQELWPGK